MVPRVRRIGQTDRSDAPHHRLRSRRSRGVVAHHHGGLACAHERSALRGTSQPSAGRPDAHSLASSNSVGAWRNGGARALGARGCGFKSHRPDHSLRRAGPQATSGATAASTSGPSPCISASTSRPRRGPSSTCPRLTGPPIRRPSCVVPSSHPSAGGFAVEISRRAHQRGWSCASRQASIVAPPTGRPASVTSRSENRRWASTRSPASAARAGLLIHHARLAAGPRGIRAGARGHVRRSLGGRPCVCGGNRRGVCGLLGGREPRHPQLGRLARSLVLGDPLGLLVT